MDNVRYDADSRGFTPTRVGKASVTKCSIGWNVTTVHPHPRGESLYRRLILANPCSRVHPHPRGESQPRPPAAQTPLASVHPHPRGESDIPEGHIGPVLGSPPPAWGKRKLYVSKIQCPRFTPTRVGKADPRWPPPTMPFPPVHPHPRGESVWYDKPRRRRGHRGFTPTRVGKAPAIAAWPMVTMSPGSPPPAWGKLQTGRCRCIPRRFRVHPHPRGESLVLPPDIPA